MNIQTSVSKRTRSAELKDGNLLRAGLFALGVRREATGVKASVDAVDVLEVCMCVYIVKKTFTTIVHVHTQVSTLRMLCIRS